MNECRFRVVTDHGTFPASDRKTAFSILTGSVFTDADRECVVGSVQILGEDGAWSVACDSLNDDDIFSSQKTSHLKLQKLTTIEDKEVFVVTREQV